MATCLICFFSVFSPDSEAIGVLTSSIGWVGYVHLGAGMLVPLQAQGAAIRVACALGGAAAGCRCKVLLRGAAVRCWCHCRVRVQGTIVHLRNLVAATGHCCQSGVRYEAWVLVSLQEARDVYGSVGVVS